MSIHKILVTGANGQLGWELSQSAALYPNFEFVFVDRNAMDLSNISEFKSVIDLFAPDAIINTAAYTAVDKAETEKELAYLINAQAVAALAQITMEKQIPFITYSTDYVFSGDATAPYQTDTPFNPVNYYGQTKAEGEQMALTVNPNSIIIRTSWVFSSHGNNFVKTMIRLMKERDALNIVGDQQGRPTYARDLAIVTIQMLEQMNAGKTFKGVYHYANSGTTTWFGFAEKIKEIGNLDCDLQSITSDQFSTPAKRPAYSVLATEGIEAALGIQIPHWETALKQCMDILQKN
jgi:dTDP-4-dehydrorhamnose reductase